jgi:hypothetical protein
MKRKKEKRGAKRKNAVQEIREKIQTECNDSYLGSEDSKGGMPSRRRNAFDGLTVVKLSRLEYGCTRRNFNRE